ncbi:unnamed protein product [Acanthoscelides obtectus]|uniref:Regulator of G-protein signaling 7 n=1 Tax=Acanthoscelides obtectus TaxID=200917 RepID=A0A9P0LF55_ACAOB|nr:unnamed protein product [Acanthoscelides obtectus]CAK1670119.1 Regulator of G-protein signaling 7 [Acanthoscelides obtectus]
MEHHPPPASAAHHHQHHHHHHHHHSHHNATAHAPASATATAAAEHTQTHPAGQPPSSANREPRPCHRPSAFQKMEGLVKEMQDTEHGGVPVRSQKIFLTSIPAAFMGYDLIEWLMERLGIEESEALNIANQLCQYGYFFPISDSKNLVVKDDSSLYRFQNPYYWPWQNRPPDNVEYAIYLTKRTLRNKQRHGLEDYEVEALTNLKKNLANKWDFIVSQAEEQVKQSKGLKKADKLISDSQERAYWRVHRPPPGMVSPLEQCPVPTRTWSTGCRTRKRTIEDCRREVRNIRVPNELQYIQIRDRPDVNKRVELLRSSLNKTRIKVSQALESMMQHVEIYTEYDPLITPTQPSNPWVSEDLAYWQLNRVDAPTEKRVKRWALSMEELVSDPTGLQEFTNYLRKEYSHENIRFWMAVNDLRRSAQSQISWKVQDIFEEFLAPGAPCEINIDGKTMERVHQEMKTPSRFTFDAAQEHVYTLLLKKDCYPRFIRSEYYKNLLATGIQPSQKKRFFGFGQTKKKTPTTGAAAGGSQPGTTGTSAVSGSSGGPPPSGVLSKRRGSDRSLSGSAHELAVAGVAKETGAGASTVAKVPHSHSQTNLTDIPYRGDLARVQAFAQAAETGLATMIGSPVKKPSIAIGASTSEDVCPWETGAGPPSSAQPSAIHHHLVQEARSRKNSSSQLDSASSSSADVSVAAAASAAHAVVEVADKFQRSCVLTQQHTVDGGSGRQLTAGFSDTPRRASVSVPLTHSSDMPHTKASFEDSAPSLFAGTGTTKKTECDVKPSTSQKTFKKSHSLAKTFSVAGTAPTISVSSASEDVPSPMPIPTSPSTKKQVQEDDRSSVSHDSRASSPVVPPLSPGAGSCPVASAEESPQQPEAEESHLTEAETEEAEEAGCSSSAFEPLAPLAEPDSSESPGSELPPELPPVEAAQQEASAEQQQTPAQAGDVAEGEAKTNDVCPWEDE